MRGSEDQIIAILSVVTACGTTSKLAAAALRGRGVKPPRNIVF
jgi:hypothetical protein